MQNFWVWVEKPCRVYQRAGCHWQRRLEHTSGLTLDVIRGFDQSILLYLYDGTGELLATHRLWEGLVYDLARGWHYDGEDFKPFVDAALELLETAAVWLVTAPSATASG